MGAGTGYTNGSSPTIRAVVRPNKSPRLLIRVLPGAASANETTWQAGFYDSFSATANGAYLRINTTGNLFFVTRQGGSETATDLGARPTVATSYEIYTDDAGVTWKCRNNETGSEVASHTTNVPTATTALAFGNYRINTGAVNAAYLCYLRAECGF